MLAYARILIVDDSRVTRRIVRGMLETAGHPNIDEAADGQEALGLLAKRSYALVISDWNMTPMCGLDLLAAMRDARALKAIPFIMITAKSQKRFSAIARDLGATHYLEKAVQRRRINGLHPIDALRRSGGLRLNRRGDRRGAGRRAVP